MHRRLCAFALVAVLVCGVALTAGGAGASPSSTRREPAVMTARPHPTLATLTTSRTTRDRLPSLLAVLAALVLVGTGTRRADRPLATPRLVDVGSANAPSRAPPAPQNFAF